jgi:hypothetical protein
MSNSNQILETVHCYVQLVLQVMFFLFFIFSVILKCDAKLEDRQELCAILKKRGHPEYPVLAVAHHVPNLNHLARTAMPTYLKQEYALDNLQKAQQKLHTCKCQVDYFQWHSS